MIKQSIRTYISYIFTAIQKFSNRVDHQSENKLLALWTLPKKCTPKKKIDSRSNI